MPRSLTRRLGAQQRACHSGSTQVTHQGPRHLGPPPLRRRLQRAQQRQRACGVACSCCRGQQVQQLHGRWRQGGRGGSGGGQGSRGSGRGGGGTMGRGGWQRWGGRREGRGEGRSRNAAGFLTAGLCPDAFIKHKVCLSYAGGSRRRETWHSASGSQRQLTSCGPGPSTALPSGLCRARGRGEDTREGTAKLAHLVRFWI